MSETQTETTKGVGTTEAERQAWQEAAAASAEAQKPADPKPRYFAQELEVDLSDREVISHARRALDLDKDIEDFDGVTKALLEERKTERGKLTASRKMHADAGRTGRAKRNVQCAEYVSLQQNRKWQVRLDTKKQLDEWPLNSTERQAELPLDDEDDEPDEGEQLSLDDVNEGAVDEQPVSGTDDDEELAESAAAGAALPDSTTNLTGDPDKVDPTEITAPADVMSGKAVKKSSKKSKDT